MRINSGKFRGFPIRTADIPHTRPTSDKVKQAIFNILGVAIQDSAVLDLFGGFGSLGLEALSRGASSAVFVEKNRRCAKIIEENIEKIGAEAIAVVMIEDVFDAIAQLERQGACFPIILCDAPYPKDTRTQAAPDMALNVKLLNVLAKSAILKSGSLLVLQHAKQEVFEEGAPSLTLLKSYGYGDTSLTIFRKES